MRTTRAGDGRTLKRHIEKLLYDALGGALLAFCAVFAPLGFAVILITWVVIRFGVIAVSYSVFAEQADFQRNSQIAAYDLWHRQQLIERIEI